MRKYTLIEVLIVFAMLAILASMLIPQLHKARKKAMVAVCQGKLKQIGTGLALYQTANGNCFPPMATRMHQAGWLGKTGRRYFSLAANRRPLNPYVHNKKITLRSEIPEAECPSDKEVYDHKGASYSANTIAHVWGLFDTDVNKGRKMKDVRSMSLFVTMSENGADRQIRGIEVEPKYYYHTNKPKWNLLYGDGHVANKYIVNGEKTGHDYTFKRNVE